jgi:hypothetical protein
MMAEPPGMTGPHVGEGRRDEGDEEGRVGPFPSWRSLYWTVVVYGLVVISVLAVLTRALGFGVDR